MEVEEAQKLNIDFLSFLDTAMAVDHKALSLCVSLHLSSETMHMRHSISWAFLSKGHR